MNSEDLLGISIIGAIIALAFGLAAWASVTKCHNQWERSGFQVDWGVLQGCMISKDGTVWIPSENYRDVAN